MFKLNGSPCTLLLAPIQVALLVVAHTMARVIFLAYLYTRLIERVPALNISPFFLFLILSLIVAFVLFPKKLTATFNRFIPR